MRQFRCRELFSEQSRRYVDYELQELLEGAADGVVPEFKEYDESVVDEVEYITCPECGHKWPK